MMLKQVTIYLYAAINNPLHYLHVKLLKIRVLQYVKTT